MPGPRDLGAILTLVLGGARSGKSRYAEWLIETYPPPWIYVATAEANNDEGRIDLAVRWALGRDPTDAERAGALQLVQQIQQVEESGTADNVDAWAAWVHTLFATAEFRYLVDIK